MKHESKYFGDRAFYKRTLTVLMPIMIQNAITNFVGLLDNLMVGRLGAEQMSGVSIANQLMFVYYLFIFGAVSGAGIFTAQYYGSGDMNGVRVTMRFKVITVTVISSLVSVLFYLYGGDLVSLYLSDDASGDLALTLKSGVDYINIMIIALIPNALCNAYGDTLRECDDTKLPMIASVTAVFTNLIFNYILIFGHLGLPAMGVRGAALATVISRYIEFAILIIASHTRKKYDFFKGLYKSLRIPGNVVKSIIIKGFPLMTNEVLWAAGVSAVAQSYSVRGLSVVAAININNTMVNMFSVAFLSLGSAIAIIVGQELGAGEKERTKLTASRLITFSVIIGTSLGCLLALCSPFLPKLYNTSEAIHSLATSLMLCSAVVMPVQAFANATYFTIRSGGKTFITFIFDSVFMWTVSVPVAFIIAHNTGVPIIPFFFCTQMLEIIKCGVGFILVKKGIWIQNIVEDKLLTQVSD